MYENISLLKGVINFTVLSGRVRARGATKSCAMRLRPLFASLSSAACGLTQSHLSLAHNLWRGAVLPGDVVVDATAGRGYDTALLVELVLVLRRLVQ